MLIDIVLLSAFCVMLLGAVVFIKKMPVQALIKNSKDVND